MRNLLATLVQTKFCRSMSANGMTKINTRNNITFQESENAKRLWMPHKHTHPALYSVCLLVLPLVVSNVFGFMGENALKLKENN